MSGGVFCLLSSSSYSSSNSSEQDKICGQPCPLLPNCACQERVEGIQPVIHVLVIDGLQQHSTVLCAHSKRVGCLQQEGQPEIQSLQAQRLMHISSLRNLLCPIPLSFIFHWRFPGFISHYLLQNRVLTAGPVEFICFLAGCLYLLFCGVLFLKHQETHTKHRM